MNKFKAKKDTKEPAISRGLCPTTSVVSECLNYSSVFSGSVVVPVLGST